MYLHEKSEDDSQVGKLEEIIAEHDLCMNLNYMPHLTVSQNSFCASPEVAWQFNEGYIVYIQNVLYMKEWDVDFKQNSFSLFLIMSKLFFLREG